MRKSWIGAFTVLALAALLIPAAPLMGPGPKKTYETPQSQTVHPSAVKERNLKLAALQNDMDATALLISDEATKDFLNVMKASGTSSEAAAKEIAKLMDDHSHFSYISWVSGDKSINRGDLPSSGDQKAKNYVAEAKKQVVNGKAYKSDPFDAADHSRYFVLGIPSSEHAGTGTVGVIKKDIVKAVEEHQKRNLRIIPYPVEGNYRIESVRPNTTIDTTVRSGEDNGNASHYHIRDAVVHLHKKLSEQEMKQINADIDGQLIQQLGDTYIFRSKSMETEQLLQYFNQKWKPEYAEPHYLYLTNDDASVIVPNDALYSRYQWNLPSIETEKGWTLSKGDDQVIIAVLDTGVQSNHPDLVGRLSQGMNIVNNGAAPEDDVGHGTHVSGIIGATVNNDEGVAGVSWYNKIMPVKVLDNSGAGSTYSVAQGIIWATDHGAKVINMSLGNYAKADFLHDAIKYAYERDVVLIAASGNDNTDRPGYPAAYPEVFAVAATNNRKEKASFSNFGDYIDVAAPGDSIASTYPGSQYAALSGTSMASPHVAALAGLIRSVNPDLSNQEVMEIMRQSAVDLGPPGKDIYFGYGEIDIDKALNAAVNFGSALQTFPDQVKRRLDRISQKYL